jgi:hypothetical protein
VGFGARHRVFARWPFAQQLVPVRDLGSPALKIVPMVCRNLSASGVGLVSSRSVRVGRAVSMMLRSVVRGAVEVRGRVVRCEASGEGRCEVVVALEEQIDVREFAPADPLSNLTVREMVDPLRLRGTVLIVSANAGDRAALARVLRPTRMIVTSVASTCGRAGAAGVDVAILTANEDDAQPGSELLDLYDQGFAGKVLLVAPDRSARVRRIVDKLPLSGVLVKPFEDAVLLRLMADVGAEAGAEETGGERRRHVA